MERSYSADDKAAFWEATSSVIACAADSDAAAEGGGGEGEEGFNDVFELG